MKESYALTIPSSKLMKIRYSSSVTEGSINGKEKELIFALCNAILYLALEVKDNGETIIVCGNSEFLTHLFSACSGIMVCFETAVKRFSKSCSNNNSCDLSSYSD